MPRARHLALSLLGLLAACASTVGSRDKRSACISEDAARGAWPDNYPVAAVNDAAAATHCAARYSWTHAQTQVVTALGSLAQRSFPAPEPAGCGVVLLPGLRESVLDYSPLIQHLTRDLGCDVIGLDLPSQGESSRTEPGNPLKIHLPSGGFAEACAGVRASLEAFLRRSKSPQANFLFAHSTGAAYATCGLRALEAPYSASQFNGIVFSSPLFRYRLWAHLLGNLRHVPSYLRSDAEEFAAAELKKEPSRFRPDSEDPADYDGRVDRRHMRFRNRARELFSDLQVNGPTKGWVREIGAELKGLRRDFRCEKEGRHCWNRVLILHRDEAMGGRDPVVDLNPVYTFCDDLNGGKRGACRRVPLHIYHSFMTAPRQVREQALHFIDAHLRANTANL